MLLTTCCITGIKTSFADNTRSSLLVNPVADANGPYYGVVNQPIIFDGSNSYDPNGVIILYEWDCGDGILETGMITTHTYLNPGVYHLILLVTDNEGNYDCDKTDVIINEDTPPILNIIHPIEKSIYYNDYYLFPFNNDTILIGQINVTANATDDVGISKVEFYIDNTLKHIDYEEPYNFILPKDHLRHSLSVIAYDSTGKQTSSEFDFFQWKIHPVLIFFICYLMLQNRGDTFNWISNENQWNSLLIQLLKKLADIDPLEDNTLKEFIDMIQNRKDDLKTSIIIKFLNNHLYLKNKFRKAYPFIYFILFYIKNDDSVIRDKILHSFYKDKNIISILFSMPTIIDLLKSSNIIDSNNFDLSLPAEWIKDHPFITASTVLLLLLLIKNVSSGDSNNEGDEPKIDNIAPVAKAGGPYIGYLNSPISFSAEGSYDSDGNILYYDWDFGDGSSGTGIKTLHSYTKSGNYTIELTVTDDQGKSDYDYSNVQITGSNSNQLNEDDEGNEDYVIISGVLSSILLIGLVGLKYRRKLFE
jgi:PKD repeat protein